MWHHDHVRPPTDRSPATASTFSALAFVAGSTSDAGRDEPANAFTRPRAATDHAPSVAPATTDLARTDDTATEVTHTATVDVATAGCSRSVGSVDPGPG
jgi:hypothetical protein